MSATPSNNFFSSENFFHFLRLCSLEYEFNCRQHYAYIFFRQSHGQQKANPSSNFHRNYIFCFFFLYLCHLLMLEKNNNDGYKMVVVMMVDVLSAMHLLCKVQMRDVKYLEFISLNEKFLHLLI